MVGITELKYAWMNSLYNKKVLENKEKAAELIRVLDNGPNGKLGYTQKDQQDIHKEVSHETDCLQCANCCSTLPALVNQEDVERIAKHLNMGLGQFVAKHVTYDEDGDMILNQTPCYFLQEDNTCSIYAVRPTACSEYPHTDDPEFHEFKEAAKQNIATCPIVGRVLERLSAIKLDE